MSDTETIEAPGASDSAQTSAELLRHGAAFDKLASELNFKTKAWKKGGHALVDVEAGVRSLATIDQSVADRFRKLSTLHEKFALNGPEYYFNLARIAAAYKIEKWDGGNTSGSDVQEAISAYKSAGELASGAIDVLATAILLPDTIFLERCEEVKHHIRILSGEYKLPKGAIALRQEIIHARHQAIRAGKIDVEEEAVAC